MATFKSELKRAINEAGITQKKLAELTGISPKQISDYMHGTIPTPEKRQKLEKVLNLEPIQTTTPAKKYPLEEAANKLGLSLGALKIGLKEDIFRPQIGVAILLDKHYSYTIFENRLEKYLKGEDF